MTTIEASVPSSCNSPTSGRYPLAWPSSTTTTESVWDKGDFRAQLFPTSLADTLASLTQSSTFDAYSRGSSVSHPAESSSDQSSLCESSTSVPYFSRSFPPLMAALNWSRETIDAYLAMPDIKHNSVSIPASYIRTQFTRLQKTFMARNLTTHYLLFCPDRLQSSHQTEIKPREGIKTSTVKDIELFYPVHEWVMASQCTLWQFLTPENKICGCPVMRIRVPHIQSMDTLFTFLHTHNQRQLYSVLNQAWKNGSVEGDDWMRGLVENIVRLGICNRELRGVIWSVIDP